MEQDYLNTLLDAIELNEDMLAWAGKAKDLLLKQQARIRQLEEALQEISTFGNGSLKEPDGATLDSVQEIAREALGKCLNVEN